MFSFQFEDSRRRNGLTGAEKHALVHDVELCHEALAECLVDARETGTVRFPY